MGKKKRKHKHKPQIEKRTENVRYLNKREISAFLAMMEERRTAIDDNGHNEILEILEEDEIKQLEAVIFNGLVDAYMLGRKNHFRKIQYRVHLQGCSCEKL